MIRLIKKNKDILYMEDTISSIEEQLSGSNKSFLKMVILRDECKFNVLVPIADIDWIEDIKPVIDSKETIVTKSEDKGLVYGGKIAHLPIEIVERMLIEQELQGNPRNVSVFEEFSGTNRSNGGFNWYQDNDGEMWSDIFLDYNFTKFYEKYPKI